MIEITIFKKNFAKSLVKNFKQKGVLLKLNQVVSLVSVLCLFGCSYGCGSKKAPQNFDDSESFEQYEGGDLDDALDSDFDEEGYEDQEENDEELSREQDLESETERLEEGEDLESLEGNFGEATPAPAFKANEAVNKRQVNKSINVDDARDEPETSYEDSSEEEEESSIHDERNDIYEPPVSEDDYESDYGDEAYPEDI